MFGTEYTQTIYIFSRDDLVSLNQLGDAFENAIPRTLERMSGDQYEYL